MKKRFLYTFLFSCCLAALILSFGTTPKSYAATLAPSKSLAGGNPCNPSDPQNTGISYDANTYITTSTDDPTSQPMGMFSLAGSNVPAIGGSGCMNDNGIRLDVGNVGASWYNVQVTVNGITTQTTPPSNQVFTYSDHMLILLPLEVDQQSTFRVQSCSGTVSESPCSDWSPTLNFTGAANSYCQDGYVWREATPFDHVCVTPDVRSQAASDNSQAASRVDPSGAYGPQSCVYGYVWREAFGGDVVCVTPERRQQVKEENLLGPGRRLLP